MAKSLHLYPQVHNHSRWLPFEEAREYVRALGLKNMDEWKDYCKSGQKPSDIPMTPEQVYREQWQGFGDWLGTGTIASQYREYLTFEEAREYVRSLGLKSNKDWRAYLKSGQKPDNIPAAPEQVYREQWQGYNDWLGSCIPANCVREHLPFEDARAYVRSLGLKSSEEWRAYCKSGRKPGNIPVHAREVYKEQWQGWGDWFGTGYIATYNREYLPFEKARVYVRTLGLKRQVEWEAYCKSGQKPDTIPTAPGQVYNEHWQGYGDWLGTGNIHTRDREYLPFEEARAFVRSLGLKSSTEWRDYCKSGQKPDDIPSDPRGVYKRDWKGIGFWLGTGRIATRNREYLSFEKARARVRALGLKSSTEWKDYCKSGEKPDNIPANPWKVYNDHWQGWGDWLGSRTIATRDREYLPFEKARTRVRTLGLNGVEEWRAYCKSGQKPDNIPSTHDQVYKDQFQGYGDWC